MFKNYLTVALRNLAKYRAYSLINVVGLAIGLASFVLILLFVQDEFSFDRHHENADDIYRLVVDIRNANGFTQTAQSGTAWGPDFQRDFPEVASMVRMKPPNQKWMVGREDLQFYEKDVAFVDSTIFDVFSIPFVRGNPESALDAPFKIVISEEMAAKYFRGEDPIGKTISLDNQYDFEVTAIMRDMPRNGHFRFGFLLSISTLGRVPIYGNVNFLTQHFPQVYTYLLLQPGTSPAALEAKFPDFVTNYIGAAFPLDDMGIEVDLFLQPLTDIHLRSHRANEIAANGDITTVYIFLAIALFILLIASINFMNLATARSASRAREVGMRKVVGAQRSHLVGQFIGESVLLSLIALVVAVVPVWLLLSTFNTLTGKDIPVSALAQPAMAFGLIGVAVVVGLLSGTYPAFFLSSFRPVEVLKGKLRAGSGRGADLRKGLIVAQFFVSIVLIVSTGIVYLQMDYVSNKKLGFDKEHVVVVELTDPTPRTLYRTYQQMLQQDPSIIDVSASSSAPASTVFEFQMQPLTAAPDENWTLKAYMSDFRFVETLDIDLLAGRTHSPDFPIDTVAAMGGPGRGNDAPLIFSTAVINRTAAEGFGWDDPEEALDKEIGFAGGGNLAFRIVGVVEDFHSQSVRETISPTIIAFANEQAFQYALVRIRPGEIGQTIARMRQHWDEILPAYAFEYTFLDEDFAGLYQADTLVSTLLGYFALLTIFIACLGLFGLASFTAEQRTKEIGVRKTLGASVAGIIVLLSKEFATLVAIAFVVATPVALWAMSKWLGGFAYRMDLVQSWWIVLSAGFGALLIALVTVSYQSMKAALTNPVDA
ncbi:MAG: ABC transporter permease, partial [Rhodothermia bacterium]